MKIASLITVFLIWAGGICQGNEMIMNPPNIETAKREVSRFTTSSQKIEYVKQSVELWMRLHFTPDASESQKKVLFFLGSSEYANYVESVCSGIYLNEAENLEDRANARSWLSSVEAIASERVTIRRYNPDVDTVDGYYKEVARPPRPQQPKIRAAREAAVRDQIASYGIQILLEDAHLNSSINTTVIQIYLKRKDTSMGDRAMYLAALILIASQDQGGWLKKEVDLFRECVSMTLVKKQIARLKQYIQDGGKDIPKTWVEIIDRYYDGLIGVPREVNDPAPVQKAEHPAATWVRLAPGDKRRLIAEELFDKAEALLKKDDFAGCARLNWTSRRKMSQKAEGDELATSAHHLKLFKDQLLSFFGAVKKSDNWFLVDAKHINVLRTFSEYETARKAGRQDIVVACGVFNRDHYGWNFMPHGIPDSTALRKRLK